MFIMHFNPILDSIPMVCSPMLHYLLPIANLRSALANHHLLDSTIIATASLLIACLQISEEKKTY